MITLAKNYTAFGDVSLTVGTGSSRYGYTGEQTETWGGIYLRARYYDPASGRFISKDIWEGRPDKPLSLNRWNYVEANPINFKDPSGFIKQSEEKKANEIYNRLIQYGIFVKKEWGTSYEYGHCIWNEGEWIIEDLELIDEATQDLNTALKGKMKSAIQQVKVMKAKAGNWGGMAPPGILSIFGNILMQDSNLTNKEWYKYAFVHEYGHVWDYHSNNQISQGLMRELGTYFCLSNYCFWDPYYASVDSSGNITYPEPPPDTKQGCESAPPGPNNPTIDCREYPYSSTYGFGPLFTAAGAEDWATTLAFYVYPNYEKGKVIGLKPGSIRGKYIEKQINLLP